MNNSFKFMFPSFTIALAIGSSLLISFVQPASAKQFKKLVETGQIIPGNNQPLVEIRSPTIGRDGQAAVNLETKTVETVSQQSGIDRSLFNGLYSISRGGTISLIDQGVSVIIGRGRTFNGFSAPSISQGKIAYVAFSSTGTSGLVTNISTLKVGTPGDVKQFSAITPIFYTQTVPKVSFANGTAYTIEIGENLSRLPIGLERVGLVDTNSPSPAFNVLSVSGDNNDIRSGSQSLILLSKTREFSNPVYKLFERPNGGQFVQLNPQGKNPGSCGFAVSSESVVSCSNDNNQYVLSGRFGKQSNFVNLPLPNSTALKSVSDISISNQKIIFKATEQTATGPIVQRIYLSNKTQAPQALISSGEKLGGKTITELTLNENGRTISDKYIVFVATFSDNSKALYRIDL